MRIIAGKLKGRQVHPPRGSRLRPVTGSVLEQLMSLFTLRHLASGPFLDLCAGSGLVGLEATSRGAPATVFVEADRRTARHLKQQLDEFGISGQAQVINTDVRRCSKPVLRALHNTPAACVMLDPPFITGLAQDLLYSLGNHPGLFAGNSLLICRTPDKLPEQTGCLQLLDSRSAGSARLWLYTSDKQV